MQICWPSQYIKKEKYYLMATKTIRDSSCFFTSRLVKSVNISFNGALKFTILCIVSLTFVPWGDSWHIATPPLGSPRRKWRLRDKHRISILMTCHYPDVILLKQSFSRWGALPVLVIRHQKGISGPSKDVISLESQWWSHEKILAEFCYVWHLQETWPFSLHRVGADCGLSLSKLLTALQEKVLQDSSSFVLLAAMKCTSNCKHRTQSRLIGFV